MSTASFRGWLLSQIERTDPVGAVARYAVDDALWPSSATSYAELHEHLLTEEASADVLLGLYPALGCWRMAGSSTVRLAADVTLLDDGGWQ